MDYNSDFRYDLKLGQIAEHKLASVLGMDSSRIEVKTDFKASKTGNLFIEYESRGKKSGISTSEAEWYCFSINGQFILIESFKLKNLCRRHLGSNRDRLGGDNNTSKGILLPVKDIINEA